MSISLFKILVGIIFLSTTLLALYQNRIYHIPVWKLAIVIIIGAIASCVGIFGLAYIEFGYWSRWSFFGCVFCVPVVYYLLSKIIKTPYDILMDFAGPICALFFAIIKINCAVKGCCGGIGFCLKNGEEIFFPVQIIEIFGGTIILILLLCMQCAGRKRGKIAPIFLILFGTMRFVLSFFRAEIVYFRFLRDIDIWVPATRLWPLVCIIWGLIWMYRITSKEKGRKATVKECFYSIWDMFRFGNFRKVE